MYTIKDLFIGDFPISQLFGQNPSMYAQFGLNGHNGIDFACPTGTKLVCCFDEAEVITVKDDGGSGYGLHIKFWDKKQKLVAIYGHCKSISVKEGDIIKFGQEIAISNNTGYSTGSHLHLGICKVDDNCIRLNTGNGFAGWVDPFGSEFVWDVKDLSLAIEYNEEVIESKFIIPQGLWEFLYLENNFSEGDIREGMNNFKQGKVKELEKKIEEINNSIDGKIAEAIKEATEGLMTPEECEVVIEKATKGLITQDQCNIQIKEALKKDEEEENDVNNSENGTLTLWQKIIAVIKEHYKQS